MNHKNFEQIKFVCSFPGIDINITDDSNKSPLFYAIATGSLEIVKYICGFPNVNMNIVSAAVYLLNSRSFLFCFSFMKHLCNLHKKEKKILLRCHKSFSS